MKISYFYGFIIECVMLVLGCSLLEMNMVGKLLLGWYGMTNSDLFSSIRQLMCFLITYSLPTPAVSNQIWGENNLM